MPQFITTNITSTGATVQTTAIDDVTYVAAGVLVSTTSPASPAYPAIYGQHDNNQFGIAGTVLSLFTSALYTYGVNNLVSVSDTGSLQSLGRTWDTLIFVTTGGQVFNHGSITGMAGAVTAYNGDMRVFNTGLISGVIHGVSGATYVENLGTIRGAVGVAMSDLGDTLINRGTIAGTVQLKDGADLFDGIGGTVTGTVFGGLGDDVFRISDPLAQVFEDAGQGLLDRIESTVSFSLVPTGEVENLTLLGTAVVGTGNALNNVIFGSQGDNRLFGLAGNDFIYGGAGAGDDRLVGGAGNDSLYGNDGNDVLIGNIGNDRLDGQDDDDLLIGGIGNDILFGSANQDRLIGGAGRDLLNGGTESDTFVFQNRSDSGTTATTWDTIYTYTLGVDVVDLSGVDANSNLTGNQAFTFAAAGGFTSVAGQLIVQVAGVNRLLLADLDGNGTADFAIEFASVAIIAVNDLML